MWELPIKPVAQKLESFLRLATSAHDSGIENSSTFLTAFVVFGQILHWPLINAILSFQYIVEVVVGLAKWGRGEHGEHDLHGSEVCVSVYGLYSEHYHKGGFSVPLPKRISKRWWRRIVRFISTRGSGSRRHCNARKPFHSFTVYCAA